MYTFKVPKMSCGGCANTITNALRQVDEAAIIEINLADKIVKIDSLKAETELALAMTNAGYPPA
ncbi:MAG: heavy-metal-associated domain-containing protein [Methylophilaceae bacterium]|nr:heavy-metal-associated domain-containing protein [Methylophilaceae bacterium]